MSYRKIGQPFGRSPVPANTLSSGVPSGFGGEAGGESAHDDFAPDTLTMTEQDLPPPNTKRWVMRRKAEVVAGVRCGLISLEEACQRYTLSVEEFLSWQRLIDSHGVRGLRATRLQDYRSGDDQPSGMVAGELAD